MLKYICMLVCMPLLVHAQQEVKPVISPDYIALINNDTAQKKQGTRLDTTPYANLHLREPYTLSYPIKKITIKNNEATVKPALPLVLALGGNYSIAAEIHTVNATPALQDDYAQGRSVNGKLIWRGPETGEGFSYGPLLS